MIWCVGYWFTTVAREMEEVCPDAWLINFTNPAGMVTEAVLRHSNITKVIGLCNVPIGMERGVADLMNVEPSRVRIDFAAFCTKVDRLFHIEVGHRLRNAHALAC